MIDFAATAAVCCHKAVTRESTPAKATVIVASRMDEVDGNGLTSISDLVISSSSACQPGNEKMKQLETKTRAMAKKLEIDFCQRLPRSLAYLGLNHIFPHSRKRLLDTTS